MYLLITGINWNPLSILTPKKSIIEKALNKRGKSNLPEEIRIGAILRDGKIIIPRSNFIFKKDDTVVFLAKKETISLVENLFRISSI